MINKYVFGIGFMSLLVLILQPSFASAQYFSEAECENIATEAFHYKIKNIDKEDKFEAYKTNQLIEQCEVFSSCTDEQFKQMEQSPEYIYKQMQKEYATCKKEVK